MPPKKKPVRLPPRRSGRHAVVEDDARAETEATAESQTAHTHEPEEAAPEDENAERRDNDGDTSMPDTGAHDITAESASSPKPSSPLEAGIICPSSRHRPSSSLPLSLLVFYPNFASSTSHVSSYSVRAAPLFKPQIQTQNHYPPQQRGTGSTRESGARALSGPLCS